MRTTEYLDRDHQYMWFLDALGSVQFLYSLYQAHFHLVTQYLIILVVKILIFVNFVQNHSQNLFSQSYLTILLFH
jgi:hypothetical protein